MAEPCWINASNKTDLPRKSGIYWFCYCVINTRMEPGCSRISPEIPLYWSSDEPWYWATVTKTASVAVGCLNVYEKGWGSSGKWLWLLLWVVGSLLAPSVVTSHRLPRRAAAAGHAGKQECQSWPKFLAALWLPFFSPYVSPDTRTSFHISSPVWC